MGLLGKLIEKRVQRAAVGLAGCASGLAAGEIFFGFFFVLVVSGHQGL